MRLAEAKLDHVEHLVEHNFVLLDIGAETLKLVVLVATTDTHVKATARQRIDHCDLCDETRRCVQRQNNNGAADADVSLAEVLSALGASRFALARRLGGDPPELGAAAWVVVAARAVVMAAGVGGAAVTSYGW